MKTISSETIAAASKAFKFHGQGVDGPVGEGEEVQGLDEEPKACTIYEHDDFPGSCFLCFMCSHPLFSCPLSFWSLFAGRYVDIYEGLVKEDFNHH